MEPEVGPALREHSGSQRRSATHPRHRVGVAAIERDRHTCQDRMHAARDEGHHDDPIKTTHDAKNVSRATGTLSNLSMN